MEYGTFVDIAAAGVGEQAQGWIVGFVPHGRTKIIWTTFDRLWFVAEERVKACETPSGMPCPLPSKEIFEESLREMAIDLKEFCKLHGFTKSNYESLKERAIVGFIKSFVAKHVQPEQVVNNATERN